MKNEPEIRFILKMAQENSNNKPEKALYLEPYNHWKISGENIDTIINIVFDTLQNMKNADIISFSKYHVKAIVYRTQFKISGTTLIIKVFSYNDELYLETQRRSGDTMWFYSIRNILLEKISGYIGNPAIRKLVNFSDNLNQEKLGRDIITNLAPLINSGYKDRSTDGLACLANWVENRLVDAELLREIFPQENRHEKITEFIKFLEQ